MSINSKYVLKKTPKRGLPRIGYEGELSLYITDNGIGLYGKVNNMDGIVDTLINGIDLVLLKK